MLSELSAATPTHGVLFDLPEVVAGVEPPPAVEVVSGDFLAGVPAGDAYVVSRILHGLDDVRAARCSQTSVRRRGPAHVSC